MPAISAAPTFWRPAFVGGPSLGSGLNASLLRKLQILAYWLGIIFPGVDIELVQGSPSGSVASGGTHAGPGDAADLQILVNGNRAPVGVYIIASLVMRLLFCVAYVRGQDVNGDGVKDDSFDAHLHIIDREGNKVPAAAVQILQFVAHQNGLVGARRDLETTVNNPLDLAHYTDAAFKARFMALTPVAATLAAHTEPAQEDDMTPDQANQLQQVFNAIFSGGGSMPDGGRSLAQSVAKQSDQIQQITNAVFSGGGSMPDGGKSLGQSLADIAAAQKPVTGAGAVDVDALASAIVAKLPGAPTAADIAKAVRAAIIKEA